MKYERGISTVTFIIIVVIVIIIGFYQLRQTQISETELNEVQQLIGETLRENWTPPSSLEGLSPSEVYISMKREIELAQTFEEFSDALLKYADSASAPDFRNLMRNSQESGVDLDLVFSSILENAPLVSNIVSIEEHVGSETAELVVFADTFVVSGVVQLTQEGGVWKISSERWSE